MTRGPLAQEFWDEFTDQDKAEIRAKADKRIEEYKNLQALRKSAGLTQETMSEALNMSQGNLSRLERNSDMLLSTLKNYVQAAGGKLNLTVELPNHPPIALSGLGDLIEEPTSKRGMPV